MRAPQGRQDRLPSLTVRQLEVWALTARGWTAAAIAQQMGTSRRTVHHQMERVHATIPLPAGRDRHTWTVLQWWATLPPEELAATLATCIAAATE